MNCPIITNHSVRKDGKCKRYAHCFAQGLTKDPEKIAQNPVDWNDQEWKKCPASGRVLR